MTARAVPLLVPGGMVMFMLPATMYENANDLVKPQRAQFKRTILDSHGHRWITCHVDTLALSIDARNRASYDGSLWVPEWAGIICLLFELAEISYDRARRALINPKLNHAALVAAWLLTRDPKAIVLE